MSKWRLGGVFSILGAVTAGISAALALTITVVSLLFSASVPLSLFSEKALWLLSPYFGVLVGSLFWSFGAKLGGSSNHPFWAIPALWAGATLAGSASCFLLILLGGQDTLPDVGLLLVAASAVLIAAAIGLGAVLLGLKGLGRGPLAKKVQ
ncbi:hypothetical protein [Caulobacter sp. BP25]|uniref:hypothetical protein n=1 Tax=Caulobacter sp. BP25 TaxID=2048900 RepID=UPI001180C76A|nr:hypothetical protein [Caulobacter sp. BP25]